MSVKQHVLSLLWPTLLVTLSIGLMFFHDQYAILSEHEETITLFITALVYFSVAWFVSRSLAFTLDKAIARRRPYPRLLKDIIAALLFMLAFVATASLFMGQGLFGALAGSGLVLAMIGFAIRNVVADTLSGIALGIEGPFRIGDWVEIDGIARGRVIEIGWRTTRILTTDATYMILPNSQIARQRIINYSAPKPQYRSQIKIMLDHIMPIEKAREIMLDSLHRSKLIQQNPSPDVRVIAYEEGGITYSVRYWLSRFDREVDCRDEIFSLLDASLRNEGYIAPHRRIELIQST